MSLEHFIGVINVTWTFCSCLYGRSLRRNLMNTLSLQRPVVDKVHLMKSY